MELSVGAIMRVCAAQCARCQSMEGPGQGSLKSSRGGGVVGVGAKHRMLSRVYNIHIPKKVALRWMNVSPALCRFRLRPQINLESTSTEHTPTLDLGGNKNYQH
jgi:hypothetical protein